MKNIVQRVLAGCIGTCLLLEYTPKTLHLWANDSHGFADGWGDAMVMVIVFFLMTVLTITIRHKSQQMVFWLFLSYTFLIALSIPLGNENKIPFVTILTSLFMLYLIGSTILAMTKKNKYIG